MKIYKFFFNRNIQALQVCFKILSDIALNAIGICISFLLKNRILHHGEDRAAFNFVFSVASYRGINIYIGRNVISDLCQPVFPIHFDKMEENLVVEYRRMSAIFKIDFSLLLFKNRSKRFGRLLPVHGKREPRLDVTRWPRVASAKVKDKPFQQASRSII